LPKDNLGNEIIQDELLPELEIRISLKAKYAQLKVLYDGRVELVIPKDYNRKRIPQFISENQAWLSKTYATYQQHKQENPERFANKPNFIDLQACNEYWTVEYKQATKSKMIESSNLFRQLRVEYSDENKIQEQLKRWLQKKAKSLLLPWFDEISKKINIDYNSVSIRGQKTRWGSCSSEANISLNRSLVFLPSSLTVYVFIHELCHTRHLNHSKSYWALVKKFDSNYKVHEKRLNEISTSIPIWVI